jgi:hypothetical protein
LYTLGDGEIMTDKRIEIAEKLYKIRGMEKCPTGIYSGININPFNDPNIPKTWVGVYHENDWMLTQENEKAGPYLTIEDESPWSAVKLLAKLDYTVEYDLKNKLYWLCKHHKKGKDSVIIKKVNNSSQSVLAHNIAFGMIYDKDSKAVIKLLEEL